MNNIEKYIIDNIDAKLISLDMSAKVLAQRIGKRPGIVTDWRIGRSFPSIKVLADVCNVLDISIDDLLREGFMLERVAFNQTSSHEKTNLLSELCSACSNLSEGDIEELIVIAKYKAAKGESSEPGI